MIILLALASLILSARVEAAPVYLSSPSGASAPDRIVAYDDETGTISREFVYSAAPYDWTPIGMVVLPNGDVLVAAQTRAQPDHAEILRLNPSTGAFSVFATEGIYGAFGMALGPSGNVFVSSACGPNSPPCPNPWPKVSQYHGATGALIGTFVDGPLPAAGGIAFGPDDNLYLGSDGAVLRYDGYTGAYLDTFAASGLSAAVNGLTFAPNGNLIVADTFNGILEFSGASGSLIRTIESGVRAVSVAFDRQGFLLAAINDSGAPVRKYDFESGDLVGLYDPPIGFPHGLATTVPEPGTAVLVGVGMILTALRSSWRN